MPPPVPEMPRPAPEVLPSISEIAPPAAEAPPLKPQAALPVPGPANSILKGALLVPGGSSSRAGDSQSESAGVISNRRRTWLALGFAALQEDAMPKAVRFDKYGGVDVLEV